MDVRSVVTKNKIKMALLNCIKEKPLANILNKDIIAKSEVSTRTFYHYYLDKDEVLNEIENEILAGLKKVNDQDYQNVTQVSSPLTNETNVALAQKEFKFLIDYCDTVKEEGTILLSSNGDIRIGASEVAGTIIIAAQKVKKESDQKSLSFLLLLVYQLYSFNNMFSMMVVHDCPAIKKGHPKTDDHHYTNNN